MTAAADVLRQILANGPLAVARCIQVVREGLGMPLDHALRHEAAAFGEMAGTADMREGTAAFLQKRPAAFKGV